MAEAFINKLYYPIDLKVSNLSTIKAGLRRYVRFYRDLLYRPTRAKAIRISILPYIDIGKYRIRAIKIAPIRATITRSSRLPHLPSVRYSLPPALRAILTKDRHRADI